MSIFPTKTRCLQNALISTIIKVLIHFFPVFLFSLLIFLPFYFCTRFTTSLKISLWAPMGQVNTAGYDGATIVRPSHPWDLTTCYVKFSNVYKSTDYQKLSNCFFLQFFIIVSIIKVRRGKLSYVSVTYSAWIIHSRVRYRRSASDWFECKSSNAAVFVCKLQFVRIWNVRNLVGFQSAKTESFPRIEIPPRDYRYRPCCRSGNVK